MGGRDSGGGISHIMNGIVPVDNSVSDRPCMYRVWPGATR